MENMNNPKIPNDEVSQIAKHRCLILSTRIQCSTFENYPENKKWNISILEINKQRIVFVMLRNVWEVLRLCKKTEHLRNSCRIWNVRGPTIPNIFPPMFLTKKCWKNNFKPCYHIEANTTNPNTILKITICFTKQPNKPKYFRNPGK